MGQYSKVLTKNTPPPNIRNINIIIIPRMKGGIITLNKNEFLVYNFICLDSRGIFNVKLFVSVRHFLVASFVMNLSYLSQCCSYPVFAK